MAEITPQQWAESAALSPDDFEGPGSPEGIVTDSGRAPAGVLQDHLKAAEEGRLEDDLAANYANDVTILCGGSVFHGHDGVRQLARRLADEMPSAKFFYASQVAEGEVAMVEWCADAGGSHIGDGVDSYLIRDGHIVAQTIHYTVGQNART